MKGIIAAVLFVLGCATTFSSAFAETGKFDKTAIGPFDDYCDRYDSPGAKGQGYVSVLKLSTGVAPKSDDMLLDGIVTYDKAEATDAFARGFLPLTAGLLKRSA